MKKKELQLLFLATSFLEGFMLEVEDRTRYKDIQKILNTLGKVSKKYLKQLDEELKHAFKQLEKITNGEDTEVSQAVFGLGMMFVLVELGNLDEPVNKKLLSIGNKIYKNVEKSDSKNIGFKQANVLVHRFTEKDL